MNLTALLMILVIGGYLFNRARNSRNTRLAKIIVGIASFFIAVALTNFLMDILRIALLGSYRNWHLYLAITLSIALAGLIYSIAIKKMLPPEQPKSGALDADLMQDRSDNDNTSK